MKKTIAILIAALALTLVAAKPWTGTQDAAHKIAEQAREMGLPEDNPIIREAQFIWWAETEDARILAAVNVGECKFCDDRSQQLTTMSVLNRVARIDFPNTIKGVVEQKGQYSLSYTRNLPSFCESDEDTQRCFRNAYKAFMGEVECPANMIYASEFPPSILGTGTYEIYKHYVDGILIGTTYFNLG